MYQNLKLSEEAVIVSRRIS